MAFGNLEDLHGSVELIFFPRTWAQCREYVEADKIYLVRGKVRIEDGDRTKIIVDSIDKDLSVARPGDGPDDGPDDGLDRPKSKSAPDKQVFNVDLVNDGETGLSNKKEPADQAFPNIGFVPPPPLNFEELEDARPVEDRQFQSQALAPDPQQRMPEVKVASEVFGGASAKEIDRMSAPARTVVVEIAPATDWQSTCRQLVQLADRYEGRDSLRICLAGHDFEMMFPNQNTDFCAELVEALERLPDVRRVQVTQAVDMGAAP